MAIRRDSKQHPERGEKTTGPSLRSFPRPASPAVTLPTGGPDRGLASHGVGVASHRQSASHGVGLDTPTPPVFSDDKFFGPLATRMSQAASLSSGRDHALDASLRPTGSAGAPDYGKSDMSSTVSAPAAGCPGPRDPGQGVPAPSFSTDNYKISGVSSTDGSPRLPYTPSTLPQFKSMFIWQGSLWEDPDIDHFRASNGGVSPLFRVVPGKPSRYFELPLPDGSIGRYQYAVLGFACPRPREQCEQDLVLAMLSTVVTARMRVLPVEREAMQDGHVPWLFERRALAIEEQLPSPAGYSFDSGAWQPAVDGYLTRLTWRVCIPGVDLSQLQGFTPEGVAPLSI